MCARWSSLRLARAKRLTNAEPPLLHAVAGETALRLAVGSPEVRQNQYQHLIDLAERSNVTFQVLRPDSGPHDVGGAGQFYVLEFDAARPIAYIELLDGAAYVQDPDEVRTYTLTFENLQRVAMGHEESIAYVKALATE